MSSPELEKIRRRFVLSFSRKVKNFALLHRTLFRKNDVTVPVYKLIVQIEVSKFAINVH